MAESGEQMNDSVDGWLMGQAVCQLFKWHTDKETGEIVEPCHYHKSNQLLREQQSQDAHSSVDSSEIARNVDCQDEQGNPYLPGL
jgi:hypothetical protein